MTVSPTLLLGLGSTKSGTTWLYQYLADHPQCHVRTRKELHYFDSLAPDRRRQAALRLSDQATRLERRHRKAKGGLKNKVFERFKDAVDWLEVMSGPDDDDRAYWAYLNEDRTDQPLVADITPSYALCTRQMMARMVSVTEDVRFVYLMRDPVSRFWSHVRMNADRQMKDGDSFQETALAIAEQALDGKIPELLARGDYAKALGKLEVLPSDKVLVLFYEDLFDGDGIAQLCRFLDIDFVSPDTETRHHEGRRLKMPKSLQQRIFQELLPQYEAAQEYLGRLPEAWQARYALLAA
ncbi:MAG: sulfotransferase [Pseudomonadota bacterium]|nr:sulfotransferase [Pseudomonadota bacterium]MEE3069783.1 sulfotransferase [Pseudomonadota bacterium]